ncbi:MAG: hypothetical protein RI897_1652 [Verrucomicrobiota bacterium]|jgi:hypothetical protein
MKTYLKRTALVALLCCAPLTGRAQLSAGLQLPQEQFLTGEALPVSVRITNFTGQTLELGRDNYWLEFSLESREGRPIAPTSQTPVQGEFDLPNATIATKRVNLTPHYPPLSSGHFILSATLHIQAWGQRLKIAPVEFDIIPGSTLWEQRFGVAPSTATPGPPEIRRYALQTANHLKVLKLYALITDATGQKPFAVFPLGPMLTFSSPEKQIDRASLLHVLYQYGARSFYYITINPDGEIILRNTYDYAGPSRPTLQVTKEGEVIVHGGVRRPASDDFPPAPKPEPEITPPPATENISSEPTD